MARNASNWNVHSCICRTGSTGRIVPPPGKCCRCCCHPSIWAPTGPRFCPHPAATPIPPAFFFVFVMFCRLRQRVQRFSVKKHSSGWTIFIGFHVGRLCQWELLSGRVCVCSLRVCVAMSKLPVGGGAAGGEVNRTEPVSAAMAVAPGIGAPWNSTKGGSYCWAKT